MGWQLWLTALGIVLVLEGLGPLLFPNRWRSYLQQIAAMPATSMQRLGAALVLVGAAILIIFS
ncbi:DUF2065 domain-containing protein [Shewanella yunxiaonensis]|uniref:DUF2065 domain-containing protein n=1 Tax=Shewanella yunxiaonensis TaxID=2829809 RepID=A0ABX7YW42_9GAMM|nr:MULTISPECIES: DUF2065 domain-containing protein [Shewanella]MDF0534752.1 DUF2065 domain-containing protein [Shewanella sp. A32]QUN06296.1 DUF2065 domain-containing protein [Shewanella yunxiaonensis]